MRAVLFAGHAQLVYHDPVRLSFGPALLGVLATLMATCAWHADSTTASFPGPPGGSRAAVTRPVDRAIVQDVALDSRRVEPASATEGEGTGSRTPACAGEMALVEGLFCPDVEEPCLERQDPGYDEPRPERLNCQRFSPSICASPKHRRPMRFCMDRYEWPNRAGELPRALVSWLDARKLCASVGKRLCSEREFTFACEGEAIRPYVYGFERDPRACNVDRPYRPRHSALLPWDQCMADSECRAAFAALDQRTPSGSLPLCKSDAGVYDLNGNVNEWVVTSTGRAALKGGWWGPVRNRCRPTVRFHAEGDYGYEVGFRCCADARDGT